MTGAPLEGPASAYPTLSTPASICFSAAKEVFVPGLIAGRLAGLPDCARAELTGISAAAAAVAAALPRNRRRSNLICSDMAFILKKIQTPAASRGATGE